VTRWLQHLLRKAVWDHDGVRDDLRGYVVEHLGSQGTVLVVGETGDVKKDSHTVGLQRQYTGTTGRIENVQVAVYLTYASDRGHALINRAACLPESCAVDAERRGKAGLAEKVKIATKPALARAMIARALDAGVPARGRLVMRCMGPIPGCARNWNAVGSATCWRWPADRLV
jgi:SRSO17 transposase